jgi:hypothetical protein
MLYIDFRVLWWSPAVAAYSFMAAALDVAQLLEQATSVDLYMVLCFLVLEPHHI